MHIRSQTTATGSFQRKTKQGLGGHLDGESLVVCVEWMNLWNRNRNQNQNQNQSRSQKSLLA